MAIDREAIKKHIRGILIALGDDPDREGLKDTPERVAKMYEEVFEGMNYSNKEIAEMLQISTETIKTQKIRAINRLKKYSGILFSFLFSVYR